MRKVLLATALAVMSGNAWAETSEFTCPSGSASTLHCFTCGSNCTMTLDTSTGHAVVEGTGDMETREGYSPNKNAWASYASSFKSIEIKSGVTSIGDGAFANISAQSIIISDTVTKIGNMAFLSAGLKNIDIPDSVTAIGDWAFDSMRQLTTMIIPDSVQTLGKGAFYNTSIQTLTIPDHLILADPTSVVQTPGNGHTFGGATNIICAGGGDTSMCDALLAQTGKNIQSVSRPNYRLDENGNVVERYAYDNNGKQYLLTADGKLSLKNTDGSTSIYNKDGNLVGIKGKKIYTVEEAEAVTAHGDRFHVSLTYK